MAVEPAQHYPAEVVRGTFFEHDVPISNMFVHYRTMPNGYARPVRKHRVKKLVAEWDRQAVGVLLLSMRPDGRMAIIDGSHRVEAAVEVGEVTLDALVYIDLSVEDEAHLYRKFGDYLKQTALDRFHAGITEGDETCHTIRKLLAEFGLYVPNSLGNANNAVVAVDALLSSLGMYKLHILRATLTLLHTAWDGEHRAYRATMINGTAAFTARFLSHPHYQSQRLAKRMQKEGISSIERRANSLKEGSMASNPTAAWGQALMALHDHRMPEGRELGEWPKKHYSEAERARLAANIREVNARRTKEERSALVRKAHAARTPEERSAIVTKSATTRRGFSTRSVECPFCKSPAGDPCLSNQGAIASSNHKLRIRAARLAAGLPAE